MSALLLPLPLIAADVKARCDFVALASRYTSLRRAGRQFVGLCPLHSERHPSFYVQKTVFKCFGCGAGGDVFVFVMRATGCDFRRALEIVVECSEREVASESEPRSGERFRASVETVGFKAREAGALHSQSTQESRARILAALDATNRRLRSIEVTNRAASAALATACEPERVGSSYLLEETG